MGYTTPNTLPPTTTTSPPTQQPTQQTELEAWIPTHHVVYQEPPPPSSHTIFRAVCERQLFETKLFETLVTIDPTAAVRSLLKRKDISAKRVGDGLWITECRKLEVDIIHWDQKIDGRCYDLVPIEEKGKVWFLLPGSDDVIGWAQEIPCDNRPPTLRKDDDRWLGQENEEITPQFLERPNRRTQGHFILRAPGTFNTIINEEDGAMTAADKERVVQAHERIRRIVTFKEQGGIMKGLINTVTKHTARIGASARSVYEDVTTSIGRKVRETFWNIARLIIGLALSIVFILLILCGIYGYFRWRIFQKARKTLRDVKRRAADQMIELTQRHLTAIHNIELEQTAAPAPPLRPFREEYPTYAIHAILPDDPHEINLIAASPLPHIEVKIGERNLRALFDTGAAVSYLPETAVAPGEINTDERPSARTANGSPIRFLGTYQATIKIGQLFIPHKFLVSRQHECPAELLIGSDLIRKVNQLGHPVNIDLHRMEVRIGEIPITISAITTPSLDLPVELSCRVTIQPRSEAIVPACIQNFHPDMGKEFVIEDNQQEDHRIYVVASCVADVDEKGRTMIQVFNPTASRMRLEKGMVVGVATPAEDISQPTPNTEDPQESPPADRAEEKPPDVPTEAHWEADLPKMPQETPEGYKVSDRVDLSTAVLTEEQKSRLRRIIDGHPDAFVGPDGVLGEYRGPLRHRVDLIEGCKPPTAKVYRVPLEKREEIEKQVKVMLEQKIIQPSLSPFSAPIVLVRKADKTSWRFTVDFRGLNAVTIPTQSVIPNIQDIIDLCGNKQFYSTVDFHSGFHQIPMEPAHCQRTAFACFLGTFEYLRMPMGLRGSPGTFQRAMDGIVAEFRAKVFVYIDDLIVTSATAEEHLADIHEVLGKIEQIGMKLRPEKCKFARERLKFLGFILSRDGIEPDPEKTKAVTEYPTPTTVRDVRAFIGLTSFYRRFIKNFAKIAACITELTRKEESFVWTPERQQAFDALKRALTTYPVLVAPRLGAPFIIEVDASGRGVGAVLTQAQDKDEKDIRVIAYASRIYSRHEKNYPAIELEALGLTYAVNQFRPYIDGAKTRIITDHAPLCSLLRRKDLTGRLAKYQIVLQHYDLEIVYRPGKENAACDALSRYHPKETSGSESTEPDTEETEETTQETTPAVHSTRVDSTLGIDFERVRQEQAADKGILDRLNLARKFDVREGTLFEKGTDDQWIIRLPPKSSYGRELAKHIHQSKFEGAHLGRDKTEQKVRSVVIWQGMKSDIDFIVRRCKTCQKTKDSGPTRIRAPLGEFPEVTTPFERLHADIVGPLPLTALGNKYIVVFADGFSKFIIAEAIPNQTADTICAIFKDRVVARFGPPKQLVTDQGTNFRSNKFEELLKNLNCVHTMSTAYHHQANGQVERANQTIETLLRQRENQEDWDEDLQLLIHAYNTAKHTTTGVAPFRVIHGQNARTPLKNTLPTIETEGDPEKHAEEIEKTQEVLKTECREKIKQGTKRQQVIHDTRTKRNDVRICIGDRVLIRKGQRSKIQTQFVGPYKVVGIEEPNVLVKIPAMATRANKERIRKVHKDECKVVATTTDSIQETEADTTSDKDSDDN